MSKMKLNLGPQHPSTHGVLRLILDVDGEKILGCEPVIGYLHRGMEKMAEGMTYLQYLPTVDRVDYLSGSFNSFAFVSAVEKLLKIEVPERASIIRVLLMELNRIASHLLWLGTYLLDLGAVSPFFYTFRERELILNYFEKITGQRMMYNYFVFGGVRHNIEYLDEIPPIVKTIIEKLEDYEKLLTDNPIFLSRTKNTGVLTRGEALAYSITGPNLRASNSHLDFRTQSDLYKKFEFKIAKADEGDCFARYKVRLDEIRESAKIIYQAIDMLRLGFGEINTGLKPLNLNIEAGEAFADVETPRGLTTCCIKSDGSDKPYRVKWRTGSFYAVQLLPKLLIGNTLSDVMAIYGSLDVMLPEVDR